MALSDYIKKLAEQDDSDVVYSTPPEESIRIIPPSSSQTVSRPTTPAPKPQESIRILPPKPHEPVVIKFKLKKPAAAPQPAVNSTPAPRPQVSQPQTLPKPYHQTVQQGESEMEKIERLFRQSDTDISKHDIWVEIYQKAQASKKTTEEAAKLKAGRFTIDRDNSIIILSDYRTDGKLTDILNDQWI